MARIRTNKNICLYCFGDLDSERVCTSCHRKADDTPAPPHHLPQRSVIGAQNKYLVGKALGEGGFGITYLAWDLQQGIKVALKEYFPSGYVSRAPGNNQVIINSKQNQAASNRGLKRFVEEARALAKIKNLSGVVNVRDFFSANGTAYIVMEFLDGVSLKKYLQRRGGKIAVDEILTIMRPVMDSLTQVHKIGLIHRDISPDNILITKYNEVKLIDFGAAKYSNPDGRSLSIVLKQGFAPPEQYDTHGEQGPWTDVYALGVTIYYAITGTLPPESIRVMMGKEAIKRPSELGIDIDLGVENALMKSLAVDRKKRFQDVESMINGLYNPRAARRTTPVTSSPSPSSVTSKAATPAPKKTAIARTSMSTADKADEKNEAVAPRAPLEKPQPRRTITGRMPLTPAAESKTPAAKPATKPAASASTARSATPVSQKASTPAKASVPRPAASASTARSTSTVRTDTGERNGMTAAKPAAKTVNRIAAIKPAASTSPVTSKTPDANKPDEKKTDELPQTSGKTKRSGIFARLFKK